jgi:hypothetical protein
VKVKLTNPASDKKGWRRRYRGGDYYDYLKDMRDLKRRHSNPTDRSDIFGFRLVRNK